MCRRRHNHPSPLVMAGAAAISVMQERQRRRMALLVTQQPYPEQELPVAYSRRQNERQADISEAPAYDLDGLVRELSLHDEKVLDNVGDEHDLPPAYTPSDAGTRTFPLSRSTAAHLGGQSTAVTKTNTNPNAHKDLLLTVPLISRHATHPSLPPLIDEFILATDALALAKCQSNGSCCGLQPQRRRVKWARKALMREVMSLENSRLGGRGNAGSACGIRGREAKKTWRDGRRGLKWGLRTFAGGN